MATTHIRWGMRRVAAGVAVLTIALVASSPAAAQVGSSGFSGPVPAGGGVALLTTTSGSSPDALSELLGDAGCEPESISVHRDGAWVVFIPGAFASVNAAFSARVEGSTPFFVRCRAGAAGGLDPSNAAYVVEGESVVLVDGRAEVQAAPGSATVTVTQLTTRQTYGDLTGDGTGDGAVVLAQEPGGSGTFYYLAALLGGPGGGTTEAVLLGDRVRVERLSVVRGQVTVTYLEHGPGEALAAEPTLPVTRVFEVQAGALAEVIAAP